MPPVEAVLFALAAAAAFGGGDFCGGLATKRDPALRVVALAHLLSLGLFALLALVVNERAPSAASAAWSVAAGLAAAFGLLALYTGLARGPMSVVAATTAVFGAAIPVASSVLLLGARLSAAAVAGLAIAAIGIVLVSRAGGTGQGRGGFGYALAGGALFGLCFALFARVGAGALFWPLAIARLASAAVMTGLALWRRIDLRPAAPRVIALSAVLDGAGGLFYLLAAQTGSLVVAGLLPNLYPAVTVLLARLVLKEQTSRAQWAGVAATVVATTLISRS